MCERARVREFESPFVQAGSEEHYPPDLELEPIHLEIALQVDPAQRRCHGSVTHTVRANRGGARRLQLDAIDLAIADVVDADGRSLEWQRRREDILIHWESPFEVGETRRVRITYAVHEPRTGLFFSARPVASDVISVGVWAATDSETERARYWMPCIDLPSVRPTLEFALRVPAALTALANGICLGEENHGDGWKTSRWRLDANCPSYLTCFVVGDLVRADDGVFGAVELAYFTTREFEPVHLLRSFGRTRSMLTWMTEKLGTTFPYPKYFQFALPRFGGAMENISLVSWDDQFLLDEDLSSEWGRLVDQINVHELAHSYFGDLVGCRDFSHAWLKESWATYMEVCWFEHAHGEDELQFELWSCLRSYVRESEERYRRPIVTRRYRSSWDLYDMHLYPGGALRLHMLRAELGDAVFWPAVGEYVRSNAGRVVETDDFRRMLERHSGRSLGRFFDQWLHRAGFPTLEVEFEWDAEHQQGRFEIEQSLEQAEKPTEPFELRIVLEWEIDGVVERREARMTETREVFGFKMTGEPRRVAVDPDLELVARVKFDPGTEKLTAQMQSGGVGARIVAARTAIEEGSRAGLDAVSAALASESFWGVRLEVVRALAEAGSALTLELGLRCLERESDPRALEPMIRSFAELRSPGLIALLERRLDAGMPPRATQAALEVLGAQRDQAPIERLLAAAAEPSFGGLKAIGALRGLAASRSEGAFEVLIDAVKPGAVAARVRPAAILALGQFARHSMRRVRETSIEALVDCLRDEDARIADAAFQALVTANASEALDAAERHVERLSSQDRSRAQGPLTRLRRGEDSRITATEKQLDKLRDRVADLESKLADAIARAEPKG